MGSDFDDTNSDVAQNANVPTGFGQALRLAREKAGLSLEQLATKTRISVSYLASLENESWGELPAAVYLKGYVRILSTELGATSANWLSLLPIATKNIPKVAPEKTPRSAKANLPSKIAIMTGLFFFTLVATFLALKLLVPEISESPDTPSVPIGANAPATEAIAPTQPAPAVVLNKPVEVKPETPVVAPKSLASFPPVVCIDAYIVVKDRTKVAIKVDQNNWVIRDVDPGKYQVVYERQAIVKIYDAAKASLETDGNASTYPSGSEIKLVSSASERGRTL